MTKSSDVSRTSLSDYRIIVTRPAHQSASLIENIEKRGGCHFLFPLIEITPLSNRDTIDSISRLNDYDIVIFISVNAAKQCINLVGLDILKTKTLVTIGKKTKAELVNHGLDVAYCPDRYFNSEALLSLEPFTNIVSGRNIAIIRGSTGRDYLKDNLIKLGASVDYIDVYSRHCPQDDLSTLQALVTTSPRHKNIIILTSASSTASFFDLANRTDGNTDWLNQITFLLGSSRMTHEIPDTFKGQILIAEDPSDDSLLEQLTF